MLFPWNAFLTAADYFEARYPGRHTDRLFTVCYLPVSLLMIIAMVRFHSSIKLSVRIVAGFLGYTLAVSTVPLLGLAGPSDSTLGVVLFLVALCGACDGLAQRALFGYAASLPPKFTQALISGTALSGVAVSMLRMLTKATLPDTPHGLRVSASVYFLLAALVCGACTVLYGLVVPRLPEVVYYRKLAMAAEEAESVDSGNGKQVEDSVGMEEGTSKEGEGCADPPKARMGRLETCSPEPAAHAGGGQCVCDGAEPAHGVDMLEHSSWEDSRWNAVHDMRSTTGRRSTHAELVPEGAELRDPAEVCSKGKKRELSTGELGDGSCDCSPSQPDVGVGWEGAGGESSPSARVLHAHCLERKYPPAPRPSPIASTQGSSRKMSQAFPLDQTRLVTSGSCCGGKAAQLPNVDSISRFTVRSAQQQQQCKRDSEGLHQSNNHFRVLQRIWRYSAANVIIYTITLSIFPGVLAEDVSSSSLGSWYPVLLIALFNLADYLGKSAPGWAAVRVERGGVILGAAIGRLVFIPAFHIAATRGGGPPALGTLSVLLGLTNGHLTSCAMISAPQQVPPSLAALAGNLMVLSLIGGLCLGAAAGFLWLL